MAVLRDLLADKAAASAAEYAVLLGLIGSALALATLNLSEEIACSLEDSSVLVSGEAPHPDHVRGKSDPKGKAKGHQDCLQ